MKPQRITLAKGGQALELSFPGMATQSLSAEFLRVHSPSAEVKGHGPGQEVLQWGKLHVAITGIERAGNYAVRLGFDDGHDTGIYSWEYLHELCRDHDSLWAAYLEKLAAAGKTRDPQVQVVRFMEP
ncbi:MAG: DUF971 domain-containing protein [Porticoccaceae bacterium]|jgi:DUF971 family protein|nr:DUF971 domain-containing protein [Porticoccaceae bacterium]